MKRAAGWGQGALEMHELERRCPAQRGGVVSVLPAVIGRASVIGRAAGIAGAAVVTGAVLTGGGASVAGAATRVPGATGPAVASPIVASTGSMIPMVAGTAAVSCGKPVYADAKAPGDRPVKVSARLGGARCDPVGDGCQR